MRVTKDHCVVTFPDFVRFSVCVLRFNIDACVGGRARAVGRSRGARGGGGCVRDNGD
jgi:hypothetical protein